jgi:hypothetical protein
MFAFGKTLEKVREAVSDAAAARQGGAAAPSEGAGGGDAGGGGAGGGGCAGGCAGTAADSEQTTVLATRFRAFMAGADSEWLLPAATTAAQRKELHDLAGQYRLQHVSAGDYPERRLQLTKPEGWAFARLAGLEELDDLVAQLTQCEGGMRLTAAQALQHPYFTTAVAAAEAQLLSAAEAQVDAARRTQGQLRVQMEAVEAQKAELRDEEEQLRRERQAVGAGAERNERRVEEVRERERAVRLLRLEAERQQAKLAQQERVLRDHQAAAPPPPVRQGRRVHSGSGLVVCHECRFSNEVTFESHHFNIAASQFCILVGGGYRVTRVEHYVNEDTRQRFDTKAAAFRAQGKPEERTWVFHGTQAAKAPTIMAEGFAIGGSTSAVPVANGAVFGAGVYTAIGPRTPMMYSARENASCVILAQGLRGVFHATEQGDATADSWRGKVDSDWCVFRAAEQLLPVYIVHYTST